ncbi:MAG TPA: PIN domain-containing protein [Candidatus Nanoarchaeia archaeon]|nr:PIN domain-containing protein [Candidatus Nanoarchaeia archaeon]
MKFYIDTCIWRDYFENRSDNFRPFGEWALELIRLIILKNDMILYSKVVIRELSEEYSHEEIENILSIAMKINSLKKVEVTDHQKIEARMLSKERGTAFADALHAVLARDNDAILVSRDRHFQDLTDIATVRKPEDLL